MVGIGLSSLHHHALRPTRSNRVPPEDQTDNYRMSNSGRSIRRPLGTDSISPLGICMNSRMPRVLCAASWAGTDPSELATGYNLRPRGQPHAELQMLSQSSPLPLTRWHQTWVSCSRGLARLAPTRPFRTPQFVWSQRELAFPKCQPYRAAQHQRKATLPNCRHVFFLPPLQSRSRRDSCTASCG